MTDDLQKLLTIIGAASGVVGTCLGVFNTWRQTNREKVKLALHWTAKPWGGRLGAAVIVHSLRIENQSQFPITIADVGLFCGKQGAPMVTFSQSIRDGGDISTRSLPLRPDSHDVITLESDGSTTASEFYDFDVRGLYVKTGDGQVKRIPSLNLITT